MNSSIIPIKLTPGKSIGLLKLGMTMEEILESLELMHSELSQSKDGTIQLFEDIVSNSDDCKLIRYICNFNGSTVFVFIVLYKDGQAIEISVNHNLKVVFEPQEMQFLDFFNTPADILVTYLQKSSRCICDSSDMDLGTEYRFPDLGLKLWRERPFHCKLLMDEKYMDEMKLVLLEELKFCFFEVVSVINTY